MNILFLHGRSNNYCNILIQWLTQQNHKLFCTDEPLNNQLFEDNEYELAISFGYRYIIKPIIIQKLSGNIINLHISYLPWNRGADPNQWSFIDNTPKGVSIHYIDQGLDTGDIISQSLVPMDTNETFRSSYNKLNAEAVKLFIKTFFYYSHWNDMRKRQPGSGSYHKSIDFLQYKPLIKDYDMKISDFLRML